MDLINLCGLWIGKDKKGNSYMSGSLPSGAVFYVFKNEKKTDKHPDYRLCIGQKNKAAGEKSAESADELPF